MITLSRHYDQTEGPGRYRQEQIAAFKDKLQRPSRASLKMSDDDS
jgi:hypothetical protein